MVALNAKAFKMGTGSTDFQYVVTPCATCTSTIKELWPTMVASEALSGTVKPFSAKVMDISQFLVDVLGIKELEKRRR